jgi:hypothetical protein
MQGTETRNLEIPGLVLRTFPDCRPLSWAAFPVRLSGPFHGDASRRIEVTVRDACRAPHHEAQTHNTRLLSFTFSASRYTCPPISLNLALICAMPSSITPLTDMPTPGRAPLRFSAAFSLSPSVAA